jgi:predicted Zn-dependent protease
MAKAWINGWTALWICALAWGALSCAADPVTGKQRLMLLSEEQEVALGRQTDAEVVGQYGLYEDASLNAYLNKVGQQLAEVSHRTQLTYHFKVLDVAVVNAFAVPGGYVYMTRGILAALNSEAELAGVVGHEIGHITAQHSAEQYSKAQVAQAGLGMGMFVSEAFGLGALSQLAQFGVGMMFLKFSRDNEREADDLGVEYASRAGYDAGQLADFFQTLERMNPGSDRTGLPAWFSTHPNPQDRVQVVRERSAQWRQELRLAQARVDREAYLKRIDGIVYGEDPRQGYLEEDTFYHPDLRFQFPVPGGWKVQNTPAVVQMVSESSDAVILFSIASGGSAAQVAQKFTKQSGATMLESASLRVNGMPAQRLLSQGRTRQGTLALLSYFIEKDGLVYVFHGLCSHNRFKDYRRTFDSTMGGFQDLSEPEKWAVRPDRVRIRKTLRAGSLRQALSALETPTDQLESLAVLNGMGLDAPVPRGMPIKTIGK